MQNLEGHAVILYVHAHLKLFVGCKCVTFGCEEIGSGEVSSIIHECNKVALSASGSHWGRPPHVGMYLITEHLSLFTDPKLRDRLLSGASIDACLTMLLTRMWVEGNTSDKTTFNKLACAHQCNVSHPPV
jgi:hypothetical protein